MSDKILYVQKDVEMGILKVQAKAVKLYIDYLYSGKKRPLTNDETWGMVCYLMNIMRHPDGSPIISAWEVDGDGNLIVRDGIISFKLVPNYKEGHKKD